MSHEPVKEIKKAVKKVVSPAEEKAAAEKVAADAKKKAEAEAKNK